LNFSTDVLTRAMRNAEPDMRSFAAEVLGKSGDGRAAEPLLRALEDPCWQVRYSAAEALGNLGEGRAAKPLTRLLEDSHRFVRFRAAEALGKLDDAQATEPLVRALEDPHWHVRFRAAEALGGIGNDEAVQPLTGVLSDAVTSVAASGTRALGKLAGAKVLIQHLKDSRAAVRRSAAAGLVNTGDERAVEPLCAVLKDDDPGVRRYAAEALGNIGDGRGILPLARQLGDENGNLSETALENLMKIPGEPLLVSGLHQADTGGRYQSALKQAFKELKPVAKASRALVGRSPLCGLCLTRFVEYSVKVGFMKTMQYFACRRCALVGHAMEDVRTATAVMDGPWEERYRREGDTVYINVAMHGLEGPLFDFDAVEIRNHPEARPDEWLQRLILAVQRDDRMREKDLKRIRVRLTGDPVLSQNTLNLIGFKFGGMA